MVYYKSTQSSAGRSMYENTTFFYIIQDLVSFTNEQVFSRKLVVLYITCGVGVSATAATAVCYCYYCCLKEKSFTLFY